MPAFKTTGPHVMQLVMYLDASLGLIPAIITAVNSAASGGLVSLTTFPPGANPQFQTNVSYEYTEAVTGTWHYKATDVQ